MVGIDAEGCVGGGWAGGELWWVRRGRFSRFAYGFAPALPPTRAKDTRSGPGSSAVRYALCAGGFYVRRPKAKALGYEPEPSRGLVVGKGLRVLGGVEMGGGGRRVIPTLREPYDQGGRARGGIIVSDHK